MTNDKDGIGNHPGVTETPATPDNGPCAPGCGCGEPAEIGNRKFKIAVCLAVVLAVCAILLYKTMAPRQSAVPCGTGTRGDNCCPAGSGAPAAPCN